jgi:heme exporter protein D
MCPLLLVFVTVAAYGFVSAPHVDRCWPADSTPSDVAQLSRGAYIGLDLVTNPGDFAWGRQVLRYCAAKSGLVLVGEMDEASASTAHLYLPLRSSASVVAEFSRLDAYVVRFMWAAVGLTLASLVCYWADVLVTCLYTNWHLEVLHAVQDKMVRDRQQVQVPCASAAAGGSVSVLRGIQVVSIVPLAAAGASAPGGV